MTVAVAALLFVAALLIVDAYSHTIWYCGHAGYTSKYNKVRLTAQWTWPRGHFHRYAHFVRTPTSPDWTFDHSQVKQCRRHG